MTLVFLDTETTGLAEHCEVWEIGLIVRGDDGRDVERCWQIRPDLYSAEPTGLRIGRYYERMGPLAGFAPGMARRVVHPSGGGNLTATELATEVAGLLDGVTVVGAVPDFDARHLGQFLRANGQAATWHYHLLDVETFAAGALGLAPPWNFDELLAGYGLKYDEAHRHTALGDARMVRDLYDAVLASHSGAP